MKSLRTWGSRWASHTYKIIHELTTEFVALRKNSWPYERIHGHTKESTALQKNLLSYEIICGLTKEFAAIRKNLRPYKRTCSLTKEFVALQRTHSCTREFMTSRYQYVIGPDQVSDQVYLTTLHYNSHLYISPLRTDFSAFWCTFLYYCT